MKRILSFAMAVVLPLFAACTPEESESPISASPASVEFPADGGTVNVVLTTDASSFTFSGQAEWLTVTAEGKSLRIKAYANEAMEPRSCDITVSTGKVSIVIPVYQAAASKYPGYDEVALTDAFYSGMAMHGRYAPADATRGLMTLYFTIDSMNELTVELFTPAFENVESVELTVGNYTLGEDFSSDSGDYPYVAEAYTFVRGGTLIMDAGTEDEEEFPAGTYIVQTLTGESSNTIDIVSGSIAVTETSEGLLVKMEFTDAQGDTHKYYYEGAVEPDGSFAIYPGPMDPTAVTMAMATYNGPIESNTSLCNVQIMMMAGTAMTNISFNLPAAEFASLDIAGNYSAIDTPLSAAGINKGEAGNPVPSHSFIMMGTEFVILDGASTMTITKDALTGLYNLTAKLVSTSVEEPYEFDVEGIMLMDGTAVDDSYGDEEYID